MSADAGEGTVRLATTAEAGHAVAILREAAAWSARFGAPIWDPASFTAEAWAAHAAAGELAGGFAADGRMAACMLLQRADALHWPEDAPGDALYLHKVAVRRDAAGAGWPARLVEWAMARAREAGVRALRLDTMAHGPLPALYERLGFRLVDPGPREVAGRTIVRMERRLGASTRTSRLVHAAPAEVWDAFMTPARLVMWLPPGDMGAQLHAFDARVGGGYEMSLFYAADEDRHHGKTAEGEDRVRVRFTEIAPPHRLVEAIRFASDDPAFGGEMTLVVTLEPRGDATEVTMAFDDLPPGLRPEDNDEGARISLAQLARHVEGTVR